MLLLFRLITMKTFKKIVKRLTLYEPVKLLEEYYYNYLINEETFMNIIRVLKVKKILIQIEIARN